MKSLVITLLLFKFSILLFGQSIRKDVVKSAIDTSVFGKWPSVEIPVISNDGNFALYNIRNQPVKGTTLVIRSLKNNWKREIIDASNAIFTFDSHKVVFINSQKTLSILTLGSDSINLIEGVSSYRLFIQNGKEWLVYQLNNTTKELKVVNLRSKVEKSFTGVINYLFSSDGNVLILLKHLERATDNLSQSIEWINFQSGNALNIWSGNRATNFILNESANQFAFVVDTKSSSPKEGETEKSIFYYRAGKEKAELLADNSIRGIDSNLIISSISGGFSKDGAKLYISLKDKETSKLQPGAVMVDVWSYTDIKLQSMQLLEFSKQQLYKAAIRINDREVVRLQQEGDRSISIVDQWSNKVYASHYSGDLLETRWNTVAQISHHTVSTDNGERQQLRIEPASFLSISPTGKYIIGKMTGDKQNFYCYNTSTGKIRNVTGSILASFDKELDDRAPSSISKWLEMGSWLENEKGVILFDRYDMWLVDPDGIKSPINLTNGFGQKNKIIFRFPEVYRNKFISANGRIIINAFNRLNKNEGFYYIDMDKFNGDPQKMTMGPYNYEIPSNDYNLIQLGSSSKPFLVRRESATQAPNYFLTSDFKTFTAVTDVFPETSYNWLTSELHTWKSLNGKPLQGILYKPENFDPKKKYPVIIHYYEKMSDQLNSYSEPKVITDHLNIPWFVSNGYLIFTPDIYYEIGKTGESALNSMVSAANYLAQFPWIDTKRIGLQGHSFGGYETNYIVTHSNLFTAAMSSAGFSNFTSDYNGISHGGRSRQGIYEEGGQNRIGATLWERPDLYIKNSPIFQAFKLSTPLLIMHNRSDRAVPFNQGLEFFTALRRLGKRAWLLQYDEGDHTLDEGIDALQHTIRVTQFFDHYLKDAPAPRWMLYGIPAKDKRIDDGLQLIKEKDKNGKWLTPQPGGLLTDEEKKKVEALKTRKPITIKLE